MTQRLNSRQPKVSVCVVTYNHEPFIEACLRSLLEQETEFDLEVIVGDDCSTDRTSEIVDRLSAGDMRLRILRPPHNVGFSQNLLAIHNAACGEYVAHLDGDDLALPGKLAKQVAILDQRPTLAVCGHQMLIVDETGAPDGRVYPDRSAGDFDLSKTIRCGMPVFMSSLMYRREARTLRSADHTVFDWYFLTDILKNGRGGFISEPLGMYRVHPSSLVGQHRDSLFKPMIELYLRRLRELPRSKGDFFAYAVLSALVTIRAGRSIPSAHWRLLRSSFTPLALWPLADAMRWLGKNGKALAR